MLVDSHCHLDFPELVAHIEDVRGLMQRNGVIGAICIGVTLDDLPRVLALSESFPEIVVTVGVHPEHTGDPEPGVKDLVALAQAPQIVGIGETGLDYYWHKDRPEWQRDRFRTHIRAARELGKPLVIHNRDATEDLLRVMVEEKAGEAGGVLHCFTESWDVAQQVLDLGFSISISGIVTFKNAAQVKDVARQVPLDRLLIETDAPYLAPTPFRGKLNQPGYVRYVAEEIARLRNIPFEEVAQATTENCFRIFPYARTRMM
ncbi:TatD family hydrolase [Propionivibrio dicarboxylicus]|nr:TatD family hydrolase [Propionivibrio dicarboxylicus]